jgi:hypothetical protein
MTVMHTATTITAERRVQLGLDFPYDWSNADMRDDLLIAKVLERGRFMDVSRICAFFGLAKIEQIAKQFGMALNAGVLGSFMPSIERVQRQAAAQ